MLLRTWHSLVARPLLSSAIGAYIAIRLIRHLNEQLSWYSVNNYKKIGKWDPSTELAVVTGGAGGIGLQIVRDLTTAKVKVAVLDIQEPTEPLPSDAFFYKVDITSPSKLKEVADAIRKAHGRDPTILINNAGVVGGAPILDQTEAKIRLCFEVNILAHFWTVKEFLPSMIRNNHGHIVSIASAASFMSVSGSSDYAASKSGVLSFHEALTQEIRYAYGAKSIRTSVVHPMYVRTPMLAEYEKKGFKLPKTALSPKDVSTAILKQITTQSGGQLVLPAADQYISRLRAFPLWLQEHLRNRVSRGRAKASLQYRHVEVED